MKMAFIDVVSIWLNAFFILACFSFLFKENPFYRFAEHSMIGAAAGHLTLMGIKSIYSLGIKGIIAGNYLYAIAIIFGLMLFARFKKETAWLVRYGMAFIIGCNVAIMIRGAIISNVVQQIRATILKIYVPGNPASMINNVIIVVFTVSVLIYFLYTKKFGTETTTFKYVTRLARIAIMCQIGYYLGNTIMTRTAFVIDRLEYLLFTWLGL